MIEKSLPRLALFAIATFAAAAAFPADTKLPDRPTKLINVSCDISEQELSPKGQAVCRYVCRDADKTKVALVFSSSGSSQCRSPIERTIKVVIK